MDGDAVLVLQLEKTYIVQLKVLLNKWVHKLATTIIVSMRYSEQMQRHLSFNSQFSSMSYSTSIQQRQQHFSWSVQILFRNSVKKTRSSTK